MKVKGIKRIVISSFLLLIGVIYFTIYDYKFKGIYNEWLEQSERYQKVLPEVEFQVYQEYVEWELDRLRNKKSRYWTHKDSVNYEKALSLKDKSPLEASRLFHTLGACHWIWATKKRVLKEKYGITWYTPSELHPDCHFD